MAPNPAPRARTVENQEFVDPDGTKSSNVITGETTKAASAKGWEVGNVAPSTKYLDADGKVTSKVPDRGKVLVVEGDVVTKAVADKLAAS